MAGGERLGQHRRGSEAVHRDKWSAGQCLGHAYRNPANGRDFLYFVDYRETRVATYNRTQAMREVIMAIAPAGSTATVRIEVYSGSTGLRTHYTDNFNVTVATWM